MKSDRFNELINGPLAHPCDCICGGRNQAVLLP